MAPGCKSGSHAKNVLEAGDSTAVIKSSVSWLNFSSGLTIAPSSHYVSWRSSVPDRDFFVSWYQSYLHLYPAPALVFVRGVLPRLRTQLDPRACLVLST